jgi:hypothetical protein
MSNYTPGVPGGAAAVAYNKMKAEGRQKRLDAIKTSQDQIGKARLTLKIAQKKASLKQAEIVAYKKAQNPKLVPEGPGIPNATQTQALNKLEAEKQAFRSQAIALNSNITTLTNLIKTYKTELTEIYTTSTPTPPSQPPVIITSAEADKLVYQYNLPMLKSAYLDPFGPQGESVIDRKLIGAPINDFTNARLAWKGVTPSRGTIQMSKIFAANAWKGKPPKGTKKNETPYGFRFLYNPTDVSMAWGIVDAFSPEYAQSGNNGMSGVAVGLMKGTIAFTLLLNRIGDLSILQEDGSYQSGASGMDSGVDPYAYTQILYPAVGTQVVPVLPTPELNSPYGLTEEPEFAERAMIWKRGTMYDIEYLFRAMGGYYSDYKSGLNGTTADRGWLQPIPMELHLGTGLRYLVRVSSLDLKHMMFNERMVPTLTTVNVVCTRYYDSPDAFKDPNSVGQDAYRPEG